MTGKDIYEENKRLRRERDEANNRYFEQRDARIDHADAAGELAIAAVLAFIEGRAHLVVTPSAVHQGYSVHFQMPKEGQ